jgi:hypothetical protein
MLLFDVAMAGETSDDEADDDKDNSDDDVGIQ